MNCTFQVCEKFSLLKAKYSFLPFQGLSGFKKESDDDDGKSTGTSDYSKHRVRVKS